MAAVGDGQSTRPYRPRSRHCTLAEGGGRSGPRRRPRWARSSRRESGEWAPGREARPATPPGTRRPSRSTFARPPAARLDSVRKGWGGKWAGAFEEVGIDLVEDIVEMDDEVLEALKEELKKAGVEKEKAYEEEKAKVAAEEEAKKQKEADERAASRARLKERMKMFEQN